MQHCLYAIYTGKHELFLCNINQCNQTYECQFINGGQLNTSEISCNEIESITANIHCKPRQVEPAYIECRNGAAACGSASKSSELICIAAALFPHSM